MFFKLGIQKCRQIFIGICPLFVDIVTGMTALQTRNFNFKSIHIRGSFNQLHLLCICFTRSAGTSCHNSAERKTVEIYHILCTLKIFSIKFSCSDKTDFLRNSPDKAYFSVIKFFIFKKPRNSSNINHIVRA